MAHLISQSGRMQRAAPFVLPRTSYYSRTPYGALMRQGPTLHGLGQSDSTTLDFSWLTSPTSVPGSTQVALPGGGYYDTSTGAGTTPSFWTTTFPQLFGQGITAAAKSYQQTLQSDFQSQLLNRGIVTTPGGQLVSATGTLNLSSLLPLLLIGGGLLLVMSMAKQ